VDVSAQKFPPNGLTEVKGTAIVVPHTHWDREWYAPLETMRFHLVQFFDELLDALEADPELPVFLLDGQSVIIEDFLEVRRDQRDRVARLVAAGRLRPGPNYVQPDEFHVSGEALVRNLLIGCQVAGEFGWVMREGYVPDTFGHVHQLPQILRGFGMETFYAMRGFGEDPDSFGSQFWWEAPDGSAVLVEWLTESYSNAAVVAADPDQMQLHHGAIVRYDSLSELLQRMARRAPSGVLLLLNGGDHIRIQADVSALVGSLNAAVPTDIRLGGLEEFHKLVMAGPLPETVVRGELRYGRLHAVFDGIGSTRTPMKALNERTEAHLSGVAERLDALASLLDGRSSLDSLRYAWRELIKNYAHDSICGCSVDEVHDEMAMRFIKIAQVSHAVTDDALARIAAAATPARVSGEIPVVVVNPSGFVRSGQVSVYVLPDLDAPVGERRFGWVQGAGVDLSGYVLVDPAGRRIEWAHRPAARLEVADALDRRKELLLDRISFAAADVPALGTVVHRLVPTAAAATGVPAPAGNDQRPRASATMGGGTLDNGVLRVDVEVDGTLTVTDHRSGARFGGLFDLFDDGDAGDAYGFAPVPGDRPVSADPARWTVEPGEEAGRLAVTGVLTLPESLTVDRRARSSTAVDVPVRLDLCLPSGADQVAVDVTVDNQARDHRLRVRFPSGLRTDSTVAESAFGIIGRDGRLPDSDDWQERPAGVFALRRFVAVEEDSGTSGLQLLTEGLHEYGMPAPGTVDVTMLRAVGWMARIDHPLRPHKIGPELATPGAQCLGRHRFRFAVRPYSRQPDRGHLYRAAEEFSVPLQAFAPLGRSGPRRADRSLGLEVGPAEVVLSAVKTAEDRSGLLVRMFNSADQAVTALLRTGFPIDSAERCNLEEQSRTDLPISVDGSVAVPLRPAQIASVLLHPRPHGQEVPRS
jgi:mannosylglycerate hydrolase